MTWVWLSWGDPEVIIITWNTIIRSHKLKAFLVQVLCQSDAMKSCVLSVSVLRGLTRSLIFCEQQCKDTPWYNHTGWLGIKHQLTCSAKTTGLMCATGQRMLNLTIILTHRCISDFYNSLWYLLYIQPEPPMILDPCWVSISLINETVYVNLLGHY